MKPDEGLYNHFHTTEAGIKEITTGMKIINFIKPSILLFEIATATIKEMVIPMDILRKEYQNVFVRAFQKN